jgi:branched-chain amino acid transport system substrate-binding protein
MLSNKANICLFLSLILCFTLISCQKENKTETIKIGILSPATGASAVHGEQGFAGAQMVLKEFEKSNDSLPVQYIWEDTQSKPDVAVSAARKLINVDKVKIVTGWLSSSDALAVAPIMEENKVLFLAVGSSSPKLSGIGNYVFRHAPLSSAQAVAAAEYVVNNINAKNIGVLYINDSTGQGYFDSFSKNVQSLGRHIAAIDSYDKTDTDMRTQIIKLKSAGIDTLYVPCVPRTLGFILKQSKELGFKPIIVSNFGAEGQELLDIAGELAEGIIYTSFSIDQAFIKKYMKIHNKAPEMLVALAYDSMNLLFGAVREKGDNPDELAEYFRNMKPAKGVTGEFHFDSKQDAVKQIAFKTVQNGEFIAKGN